jgi:hypothetical protein
MRSNFVNALQTGDTFTTNGMVANSTTGSSVLDLFSQMGGLRKNSGSVVSLFENAIHEDALLAVRAMYNCRDIRGGQGERDTFRFMLRYLCQNYPEIAANVINFAPFFGRWDDVLVALDTPVESVAVSMISIALRENEDALCAKWMPRESGADVDTARKLAGLLRMSPRTYRVICSRLSNTVEQKMCANEWEEIDFNHVPSLAMHKLMKAFWKHQPERYGEWVEGLTKVNPDTGKTFSKVNAGAIFPHDIISEYLHSRYGTSVNKVIEAQWIAQPNFIEDGISFLPLIDVSGSMEGMPMDVAVSLGIYLSERNKSVFKDAFITFSARPRLEYLTKKTVAKKILELHSKGSDWSQNTDLEAAYRLILDKAVAAHLPQEDMPSVLIIISDLQFDRCIKNNSDSALNMIKRMYAESGYAFPALIFWNVDSHSNTPAKFDDKGVALVSGFSPSVMKSLFKKIEIKTPYESMLDVLNSERYSQIKI